ncbi:MAG: type I pullulanase [Spirochaetaceae bacterium]|jgi:pullulanase|nr:type I pullulanase [Spirochaetaceae bacterium]
MKNYFLAAALGNGDPHRFVRLVRELKGRYLFLHFLFVTAALNLPVLYAVARLSPSELYTRLLGAETLPPDFDLLMYQSGYGPRILLPLLLLAFAVVVILQLVFYFSAAFFLGLHRMTSFYFSFKDRIGLFIMASTLPVIGAAIFGMWLPTVHIIVFYLALIPLTFWLSRAYDRAEKNRQESAEPEEPVDEALGVFYSPKKTIFRVWSPSAKKVELLFFRDGENREGERPFRRTAMIRNGKGVWTAEVRGRLKNLYYLYRVTRDGLVRLVVDPYAKAVGVNGERGMVIDLAETDPPGFREHPLPPFETATDAVIYELHIRDLSMHPHSGIGHRGKFLGLTETGTKNAEGLSTGLDHIRELGVTHVHLLPCFDFKTLDESKVDPVDPGSLFNWGYDPQNYNVPEGSYSTNPRDGALRVREFKAMVQALHAAGLRVVMDVVYNHVYSAEDSNFTALVPGCFFRTRKDGTYSDGSACGNETASERPMVRKFILESLLYWAREYRIDGFRFDLMGLHDIDTMNLIRRELDRIDPSIIVYGEGWTAADSPLPEERRAVKLNAPLLSEGIACFSDDLRDGVKGSVFFAARGGFVNGDNDESGGAEEAPVEDVKFGMTASVEHPGVEIGRVRASRRFWALSPSQTVNYVSAHDNLSLWDKLMATNPGAGDEELKGMNKLAAAIVLTSQGIPFFQAGEEMARTKQGDENSFRSSDSINMLDWDRKSRYTDLVEYYRGLIQLRKTWAVFRLRKAADIREGLRFFCPNPRVPASRRLIAYTLEAGPAGGPYPWFVLIFNGAAEEQGLSIPPGEWDVLVNGEKAGIQPLSHISGAAVSVPAKTALVLAGTVRSQEYNCD